MKKTTTTIAAGAAILAMGSVALAAGGPGSFGPRGGWGGPGGGHGARMFAEADVNGDGALSLQEVTTWLTTRFRDADTNGDSQVTKAEIVAAIENNKDRPWMARRAGRIADRIVWRMDLDDDGKLAFAEIENRAKKRFALMDRNDDGKIEKAEIARSMPGRMGGRGGFHHRMGEHGMHGKGMGWWRDGAEPEGDDAE